MKFFALALSLVAALLTASLFFTLRGYALVGVEHGGVNHQSRPSKLFAKADSASEVLNRLPSNGFARYIQSGSTGKWHYVRYRGRDYAIYGSRIDLGYYRLANTWVLSKVQLQYFLYVCLGLTLVSLFMLFRCKPQNNPAVLNHRPVSRRPTEQTYTKSELDKAVQSITSQKDEELKQAVYEAEERHRCALAAQRKRIENELTVGLKQELEKEYAPTLAAMHESYQNLKSIHEKAIADARAFDVDFKDKSFESILKGRLFEICMASYFEKNLGLRIVDWTPDKGILSGIFVESNLHPDLLLGTQSGEQFGVECKYIGRQPTHIKKLDMVDAITWAKEKQAPRYASFGRERDIPVWIAIGHLGPADAPSQVFLTPIDVMRSHSRLWEKSNSEWACRLSFFVCLS